MKALSITILVILCLTKGYSQVYQKENITPKRVTSIGGISIYNDSLYLLLPSNIMGKRLRLLKQLPSLRNIRFGMYIISTLIQNC
jgi:hypothetical protein